MIYSISHLKQEGFFLWERPPGRDRLDRGQEAAPTKPAFLNWNYAVTKINFAGGRPATKSRGVAPLPVTFFVRPKKVTQERPPHSATLRVPCVARLARLPHKLARSATRPRAQTYSSEFPDQPPLLGGGTRGMKSRRCGVRCAHSFCFVAT